MSSSNDIENAVRQADCGAPEALRRRIWKDVAEKLQLSARSEPDDDQRVSRRIRTWKIAAAMILTTGLIAGGLLLRGNAPRPRQEAVSEAVAPEQPRPPAELQTEIFAIRAMAAAGDVKGLAMVLSEGQFESKLVAANFLAKMAPMPALETVSMHAVGELRVDRQKDKLRLYSTKFVDWLELTDGTLIVHRASGPQQAALVRLTLDREGNDQQWRNRQREWASLRKERADLEKKLAGTTGVPSDVNQLRERIERSNEILDLMDGAIYARPVNGGLHLEDRVYHREASLFPSESGVRVEWHGDVVDANSVTLLHGLAPVRTEGPATPPAGWRSRFDAVYSLAEGELLRWVRTPFIPERRYYAQELHYYGGTDNPPPPLYLSFRWDGTLRNWAVAMHECGVGSVLTELGLRRYEIDGPKELFQLRLGGDWIVRTGTPVEPGLRELEKILARELGRQIRFVRQQVQREVIVVRGRYERRYLEGHEGTDRIYLFAGDAPGGPMSAGGRGRIAEILDVLGDRFNLPIVREAQGLAEGPFFYQAFLPARSVRKPGSKESVPVPGDEKKLASALVNLTRQTSLEFSCETRPFDTWFITESAAPNRGKTGNPPLHSDDQRR
jgi:hypothetical protein